MVLFLALAGWRLAAGAAPAPALSAPARDLLVRKLYSAMERPADFEEAAATAAQAGIPEQTIAEARLAFCVRTRALDAGLPGAIEALETMRSSLRWQKNDSRLFESPDELEGTLFFARALLAEAGGDERGYERCMKEAFWWNPSAGTLFGNALREHRERAALAAVTVPPDMVLRDSGGSGVAIKDLLAGHKALLLEFWASWCAPCMSRMDDLEARAQALAPEGVAVAGVDVEEDPSLAGQVRLSHKITCSWLVEAAGKPLCQALKVQEIPHVVLLSPGGAVLFSGHPDDAGLRKALAALGVHLKQTK
jgi:thiol-disulfide isomerase/thioredoxin